MKDYTQKPWVKMPLSKLKTPRNGAICYPSSWWCVTPDQCVLFFRGSPQCNANRDVAESIQARIHQGCTVEHVEVAYLDHDCSDYV